MGSRSYTRVHMGGLPSTRRKACSVDNFAYSNQFRASIFVFLTLVFVLVNANITYRRKTSMRSVIDTLL